MKLYQNSFNKHFGKGIIGLHLFILDKFKKKFRKYDSIADFLKLKKEWLEQILMALLPIFSLHICPEDTKNEVCEYGSGECTQSSLFDSTKRSIAQWGSKQDAEEASKFRGLYVICCTILVGVQKWNNEIMQLLFLARLLVSK